jgi:hypothetical protein
MADVNLSPRQLAALLDKVDEALKTVAAVREELIRAMAARRRQAPVILGRQAPRAKRA